MTVTLQYLRTVAPNWVAIQSQSSTKLEILATPLRAGGENARTYRLTVSTSVGGALAVREDSQAAILPSSCPERHVNPDGSFCLGLYAGEGVADLDAAVRWWRKLELYLECQEVAFGTGQWPTYAQLSHGSAGEIELQAEHLATKLGLIADYQRGVRFGKGFIAQAAGTFHSFGKLLNGRSPCVCGYKNKSGKVLLRRECAGVEEVGCIVRQEVRRRKAVSAFWKSFVGTKCCGTMKDCPLK